MGRGHEPAQAQAGIILAATGMLAAQVLPLQARRSLCCRAADVVDVDARRDAGCSQPPPGLAGASHRARLCRGLCGAATTLALLGDGGVGGSAAAGYWAMVLAVWLGSALGVIGLASLRPRDQASRRALGLAVPVLFGAVVFYLWKSRCAASVSRR